MNARFLPDESAASVTRTQIVDDSMAPTLLEGDIVLVELGATVAAGDIVAVHFPAFGAVIGRLRGAWLAKDNPAAAPVLLGGAAIVGVVRRVIGSVL